MKIHACTEAKLVRFRFFLDEWCISGNQASPALFWDTIQPYFTHLHDPFAHYQVQNCGKVAWSPPVWNTKKKKTEFSSPIMRVTEFRSLAALKGHTRSFQGRGKYTLSTICPIFKRFQLFFKQFYRCRTKFSYLYHKCLHDWMIKTDWFASTRSC